MSSSFHVVNYQAQQTISETFYTLKTLLDNALDYQARERASLLQVWAPSNFNSWTTTVLQPKGASAMAFDGNDFLWVINKEYNSVSIYDFGPGPVPILVTILSSSNYNFSQPSAIAYDGSTTMFITNAGNNSLTLINTSSPYLPVQNTLIVNYNIV